VHKVAYNLSQSLGQSLTNFLIYVLPSISQTPRAHPHTFTFAFGGCIYHLTFEKFRAKFMVPIWQNLRAAVYGKLQPAICIRGSPISFRIVCHRHIIYSRCSQILYCDFRWGVLAVNQLFSTPTIGALWVAKATKKQFSTNYQLWPCQRLHQS